MKAIDRVRKSYAKMFPDKKIDLRLAINNLGDINLLGPGDSSEIDLNVTCEVNGVKFLSKRVMSVSFNRTGVNKYDLILNIPTPKSYIDGKEFVKN